MMDAETQAILLERVATLTASLNRHFLNVDALIEENQKLRDNLSAIPDQRKQALRECLQFMAPITQIHAKKHFNLED